MIPIVLHIPHASRLIPNQDRGRFALDDDALALELLAMTDAWIDEMFKLLALRKVIAPVSRLVCDMKRFRNAQESMAAIGMGATCTCTSTGAPLRELYMDEATGFKFDNFDAMTHKLRVLAAALGERATDDAALHERLRLPGEDHAQLGRVG